MLQESVKQEQQSAVQAIIGKVKLEMEERQTTAFSSQQHQETVFAMIEKIRQQSPEISPNRKHLARNYAQILLKMLDDFPQINPEAISVAKQRLKMVDSIQHLADVFKDCQGFSQLLDVYGLQNCAFAEAIFNAPKIVMEERLAMLESYPKFVWGVQRPWEFISFTDENKWSKLEKFTQLARNCDRMSYKQICHETRLICQQLLVSAPPTSQHTKHITQLWLNRVKGCLVDNSLSRFFEEHIDEYPISEIIDRLKSSRSRKVKLQTFKAFLCFPEIRNYINDHLVSNKAIIKEILEDTRLDVRTKLTLIEKYPMFLAALEDPYSLKSWKHYDGTLKLN